MITCHGTSDDTRDRDRVQQCALCCIDYLCFPCRHGSSFSRSRLASSSPSPVLLSCCLLSCCRISPQLPLPVCASSHVLPTWPRSVLSYQPSHFQCANALAPLFIFCSRHRPCPPYPVIAKTNHGSKTQDNVANISDSVEAFSGSAKVYVTRKNTPEPATVQYHNMLTHADAITVQMSQQHLPCISSTRCSALGPGSIASHRPGQAPTLVKPKGRVILV